MQADEGGEDRASHGACVPEVSSEERRHINPNSHWLWQTDCDPSN